MGLEIKRCFHSADRKALTFIINLSIVYREKTFLLVLESEYLFINVTKDFLAVSYDSSKRIRSVRKRSLVSITSSLLAPPMEFGYSSYISCELQVNLLRAPSSFTSWTILLTL